MSSGNRTASITCSLRAACSCSVSAACTIAACRLITATSISAAFTSPRELPARQPHELLKIRAAPPASTALAAEFRDRLRPHSSVGAARKRSRSLDSRTTDRRHGIAEIVQNPLGELGECRLKGLVDHLSARFGHARNHSIKLARENANLVLPIEIQAPRQILARPDGHRMASHPCERGQNHTIQDHDQQNQHDYGRDRE